VLIRVRNGDTTARPFEDRLNFEMYNFGHVVTAACVHHRVTGKKTLLEVALKAADFLAAAIKDPTPEFARHGVCPSHYMGVVELYRTTRERKHLALAKALFELRDQVRDGTDDNQDRIPFRKQTEAVGHAVRANYLYAGAADVMPRRATARCWNRCRGSGTTSSIEDVCDRRMWGAYDGHRRMGRRTRNRSAALIRRTAGTTSFRTAPPTTKHAPSATPCGTGECSRSQATRSTPTFWNSSSTTERLAGVSLDGKRFFYTNTLRQLDQMPVPLRWSRQREPWISCFCCPPNIVRTIAEASSYAYGRSDDAIWVHLYGSSTLDTELSAGGRLKLTQTTDYPWDGG
jgi:DUF1680 family protein